VSTTCSGPHHLPALRAAGVQVQVLAVWVDSASLPEGALRAALRLIDVAHREADASQGALRIVASTDELDEALRAGAVAGILSLEGAEPLGRDPGLLRLLRRLGVRLLGPAWNRANAYVEGAAEDTGAGLTALGGRLLAEMAEAGVGLDVSHLTERGALEALERFDGPRWPRTPTRPRSTAARGTSRTACCAPWPSVTGCAA
jgi:membrane dipeptidase